MLGGRIVQDVWLFRGSTTGRSSGGTTLRLYDPRLDGWHSIWFYPAGNVIETFIARQKNDEIVLDGSSPTGLPEQWISSKITANSFDWREIVSADQGASWHVTEHMWIERRPAKQTQSSRCPRQPGPYGVREPPYAVTSSSVVQREAVGGAGRDASSFFITTPPFMTNLTRSISVTSVSGLPATAMMSANFPFSRLPTRFAQS